MCSPRMVTARTTARTGVMLLRELAIFGPISRLDSKFSSAAAPGNSNPTQANRTTALASPPLASTKNGCKTPKEQRRGRDANCHAQPGLHPSQPELGEDEAGAEHEHRREGKNDRDGDGCCPASGFQSTMVAPTIANAEVANSAFEKN